MVAQSAPEDAELVRLRSAFSTNPRSEAFAALAERLCELGQPEEAEQVCRKGLVFRPDSLDGKTALARALFLRGRLAEAQELLLEVVTADADHPEALRRLGQLTLRRGDKRRARAILEYAELLLPGDAGVADLLVQAGGVPAYRAQRTPSALRPLPPSERAPLPGAFELDDPTVLSPSRPDDLSLAQPATPPPVAVPRLETLGELARARAPVRDDRPAPVSGTLYGSRLAELARPPASPRRWPLLAGVAVAVAIVVAVLLAR